MFYLDKFDSREGFLSEEESRHCIKVLRHKKGDKITIVNGLGKYFFSEILNPDSKKCLFKVLEIKQEPPRNYKIHIVVSPVKNIDRIAWMIEKLTEIGVDEISFIECENSERKIIKTDRLKNVAIAAMKQSRRASLPVINDIVKFSEILKLNFNSNKFIAYCKSDLKSNIHSLYEKGTDVVVIIGPEGDFSEKEIEYAKTKNFVEISLGNSVLRTETAAIFACSAINLINI